MRTTFHLWLLPLVFASCISGPVPAQPFEWRAATPESQGQSSAKLEQLKKDLAARGTQALLVIRNDRIVYEWYAAGHSATKTHYTASMAKALVAGLSLGVALSDRRLALDDRAAQYIPQWKADPRKSRITLRQLGSHTSGLEDAEEDGLPHQKLTGWKGDFWKRLKVPNDPFTLSRDKARVLFDPGTKFQYSNPGIAMLTYAVTAALRDAPHKDIRTLLRERVMRPIGVPDRGWSVGYGQTFTVNGLPLVCSWGGGGYTARATARVGRLLLRGGDWDGKQLLSKDAAHQITTDAGTPGHGAIGWWSNASGKYARLPKDAFWGSGAGHQVLLVVPSLKLIAVRNGGTLSAQEEHHDSLNKYLFEPLLATLNASEPRKNTRAPYPPSPVIAGIDWADAKTIIRRAKGSDNWPLTWADDDQLYTAYGDGNGFEPRRREKLSLGFAKIAGAPPRFRGINISSPGGDQKGGGPAGKKASGILMADGVLYLWVRNAGNAQLAWSADHAKSWTWADWKFTTSFGCPTFLNFGKNYTGARDEFVYIYSHDQDSAYQPADRMVLARVPRKRITERGAYEFLKSIGTDNEPTWTRDIAERGAVFTNPGKCYRSGVSYDAGLKRYLWCQILPGGDPRFRGGFGVYDAPEPWGPWTTVFHADAWDVGPGETNSFPTKWMSTDGTSLYLVFSGDDCFCVRGAKLRLSQPK
jgi:CubicO group peptidase (beta-lactamase class C family)